MPEYVKLLASQGMIPSMSRPANPYDNASCESFMRTLKREEIYANTYRDLEDLRAHIEEFIERYYNRIRLHSALGYVRRRSSNRTRPAKHPARRQLRGCKHEFFQAWRNLSMGSETRTGAWGAESLQLPAHPIDESPTGYSLRVALQQSRLRFTAIDHFQGEATP